jgi:hypothetical protein
MNNKDTKHIFTRARKLRKKGLLPTNISDWENEPTALAFTDFTKSIVTYNSNDLYQAFLTGYKMGLLSIGEVQLDAEFNSFKKKLEEDDSI